MNYFKKMNSMTLVFSRMFLLAGVLTGNAALAASITEPPTTFYGRVIGVGGTQPFLLQEGDLDWKILRADGSELDIMTSLYSLNQGTFSYQMEVPHAVSVDGQDDGVGIPMPPNSLTNEHAIAHVNGVPAEFMGPSGSFFEVGQQLRASTYRLDLMVDIAPLDSDGDGMPDWWEDLHGLDKSNPADGSLDSDHDGILNRNEYQRGTNPFSDNRVPGLLTREILVYTDKTTGLLLNSSDLNSAAEDLVYTLTAAPAYGNMILRNAEEDPDAPDSVLVVGSSFSQADVDAGRLVFKQEGEVSVTNITSFSVFLQDENLAATATNATVAVTFYEPPSGDIFLTETDRVRKTAHGSSGRIIWDTAMDLGGADIRVPTSGMLPGEYSVYQSKFGADRGNYFVGGRGADELHGGMEPDVFVARQGANRLSGGGGSDAFIFMPESSGTNTINDYSIDDADVLNLRGKLAGVSGRVDDYVLFETDGADTLISVDDLTVRLKDQLFSGSTFYDWVLSGLIQIEPLKLKPRLSVKVTDAVASENGGNSGVFTLVREGDSSQAITARIALGGVAKNGEDYSLVALSVPFAPGESEVDIIIEPFKDYVTESDEVIELVLQDDADYLIGSTDRGTVTLKDLQAVVGIQVVAPLATTDPVSPGALLVTRSGPSSDSLLVFLNVGGKAVNGADYEYIPAYLNFDPNQTSKLIEIKPLSGAVLDGGAEVVDVAVQPHSSYALADLNQGRITLVARRDRLSDWQDRMFPDSTDSLERFALSDPDSAGVNLLDRYAFGMDALNPDRSRLPKIVWRDGHMTVDVHRNPEATDISIVAEVSNDLETWTESETSIRQITVPAHAEAADIISFEVVPLVETEEQVFVRIRVIQGQ